MRFGKALCGITAALTLLSSAAITAQAEETELKLLTAKFSEANGANGIFTYGGGYLAPNGEGDDKSKFFHIGEKELAEWRETGKFTFTNLESDFDPNGYSMWSGSFDEGGYYQFCKQDSAGNVTERQVVHLDKSTGKISKAYTLPTDWCYTRNDGYTFGNKLSDKTLEIAVYDAKGNKKTASIPCADGIYSSNVPHGGENVGYVTVQTGVSAYELYEVKKDASLKLIAKNNLEGSKLHSGITGANENCVVFVEQDVRLISSQWKLYSADDGKIYDFNACTPVGESGNYPYSDVKSKTYGSNIIMEIDSSFTGGLPMYVLLNFKENKAQSKMYKSMSTTDGKIYLVQTKDGKWGYIDSNGKELAMYDNAAVFDGDYAPVVKDGKAYLIDRNMNKVSEAIDGSIVGTADDGLYFVATDNESMLVTYANGSADEPTSEPTSGTTSEPTSGTISDPTSSTTTSEPTSSATQPGGNNPPTGAALVLLPVAAISGAVAVISRKRRK